MFVRDRCPRPELEPPVRDRLRARRLLHDGAGGCGRLFAAAPGQVPAERPRCPRAPRDLPARPLSAREHEDLVTVWLWSEHEGVFSHETALSLHDLSDVLPARIHLTLPVAWAKRRFRVPEGVVLHHADIAKRERTWMGTVPVTSPRRTLIDVRRANVSPEIVEQAIRQAAARGLIGKKDAVELESGRTS